MGLLLALSLAGCGGNDENNGVAGAGGTPKASAGAGSGGKEAGLKYAQCMRENGVPNFPDPEVDDSGQIRFNVPDDIADSIINAGEEKCREYRPFGRGQGGPDPQRIEQLRKHAQCMRANGIPNFPDPQDDGSSRIDPKKLGLSGEDDPKLKAAEDKCRQFRPTAPTGTQRGNG
ncbi:hypothetical protein [Actinomadura sp. HBU206391]|uniref:hypothetical protein n=1 Tax=Actinomadura sp. HBU206391 TaxID=2731692 RepID=UPI001650C95A|nr:hypothetical protein [Actinomadura sp. HBU206391]MBC6458912.1 hypothetical protein [Actinomadura sp. HBU206391]